MSRGGIFLFYLPAMLVLFAWLHFSSILEIANSKIYDTIAHAKFSKDTQLNNTVIVDIDNKSIEEFGQWPWPRLAIANIIYKIAKSHPASIGVDILFSEQDRTSPKNMQNFYNKYLGIDAKFKNIPQSMQDNDDILAKSAKYAIFPIVATSQNSSLSCQPNEFIQGDNPLVPQANYFICNLPKIQKNARGVGFINSFLSSDGIIRKYQLLYRQDGKLVPSLAIAMLKSINNNLSFTRYNHFLHSYQMDFIDKKIISNEKSEVFSYFYPSKNFTKISAIDLLQEDVHEKALMGKFVLIGVSATALSDKYITSDGSDGSGVYAHASFLENIFSNRLLYMPEFLKNILFGMGFLASVLMLYLLYKRRYLLLNFIFITLLFASIAITWYLTNINLLLPIGHLIVPICLSYMLVLFILSFILQKHKKDIAIKDLNTRTSLINSMMRVIEARDSETGDHILRVKEFARCLMSHLLENDLYSEHLNEEKAELIYQAIPLHDIGKIGIEDSILKKPGILSDNERELMKKHTRIGYELIEESMQGNQNQLFIQIAANIALYHHEKWDGNGYLMGLKADEIPFEARIASIADVYDALTSRRYYKKAFDFEKSEQIIIDSKGTHFDPLLIDAFMKIRDDFKKIAIKYSD